MALSPKVQRILWTTSAALAVPVAGLSLYFRLDLLFGGIFAAGLVYFIVADVESGHDDTTRKLRKLFLWAFGLASYVYLHLFEDVFGKEPELWNAALIASLLPLYFGLKTFLIVSKADAAED